MHVMGIVNVTPDSFSDGGKWASAENAVAHGRELIAQGAAILDIGGESTRPGAQSLSWQEEWERIEPVLEQLAGGKPLVRGSAGACGALISVDTYHAETARRAVELGATIINDVTGGSGDSAMFETIAELGCDYVLQHSRGNAQTMDSLRTYDGHIAYAVRDELLRARDRAVAAGIDFDSIILDPGLGFAKTGIQDWDMLGGIHELTEEGNRVLVGASRKRFLDEVSRENGSASPSLPEDRDLATAILTAFLYEPADVPGKVWAVRVHNVQASMAALKVASNYMDAVQRHIDTLTSE